MFGRKRRQQARAAAVAPPAPRSRAVTPDRSRSIITETTTVYDDTYIGYGGGYYTDPVTALVETEIVEDALDSGYGGSDDSWGGGGVGDFVDTSYGTGDFVDTTDSYSGGGDFSSGGGDFSSGGGDFGGGGGDW